jgi:hypothetical protein
MVGKRTYLAKYMTRVPLELSKTLNEHADTGWVLVSAVPYNSETLLCIFVREVE